MLGVTLEAWRYPQTDGDWDESSIRVWSEEQGLGQGWGCGSYLRSREALQARAAIYARHTSIPL